MNVELTEHLGYDRHAVEGRGSGNSRNGSYPKTVTTEIGKVAIDVPRDRNGSFEPVTVPKGQRRLDGLNANVISLYAKGMTTGDIQAHLSEIYGTDISRDTISMITDAIVEDMTAWQHRPLDRVYPVILIDAIVVKIRDGQVANRPVYVAMGINLDGERDVLGMWVGPTGGEGAKFWIVGPHRAPRPWHPGCVHRLLRRAEGATGVKGPSAGGALTRPHPRAVADRDPRSPPHRCLERPDRGPEPDGQRSGALRPRVPELRALQAPRPPPSRTTTLARPANATRHPNPTSPRRRVEPVNNRSLRPVSGRTTRHWQRSNVRGTCCLHDATADGWQFFCSGPTGRGHLQLPATALGAAGPIELHAQTIIGSPARR